MDAIPIWLLVVFIALAVGVGLWVGGRAGDELEARRDQAKPIGARVRDAATRSVVSLWRWNRKRKKAKANDKGT